MRKLILSITVTVVVFALAGVAYSAIVQEADITVKPNRASTKKKPVSASMRVQFGMHDDTGGKPAELRKVEIRLNKGGRYNARYLKNKCVLAKLKAEGPNKSCKKAQIGKGTGEGDARPFINPVHGEIKIFNGGHRNGGDEILVWALPEIGPIIYTPCFVKKKGGLGKKYDHQLTCEVPNIPTLPGQPDASVTKVDTITNAKWIKKGKGRRSKKVPLIQTPTKCTGKWWGRGILTYETGQVTDEESFQPCKKARKSRRRR